MIYPIFSLLKTMHMQEEGQKLGKNKNLIKQRHVMLKLEKNVYSSQSSVLSLFSTIKYCRLNGLSIFTWKGFGDVKTIRVQSTDNCFFLI